jgi:hypothetical protein
MNRFNTPYLGTFHCGQIAWELNALNMAIALIENVMNNIYIYGFLFPLEGFTWNPCCAHGDAIVGKNFHRSLVN